MHLPIYRAGPRQARLVKFPMAARAKYPAYSEPAMKHQISLPGVLADPRVRLGAGVGALLATVSAVRRDRVGPWEASAFRAVNGLPDSWQRPAWVVMQLGTLGAVPVAAATAWLAGDDELAGRLLVSGIGTWELAKAVKQIVRRPRPVALLPATRRRGREAAGLGYLSGHAAVAVALGAAATPRLGPGGRALALSAIPLVGLSRVYVGAHLPLDIAGGAALGLAVDATVSLVASSARRVAVRRHHVLAAEIRAGIGIFPDARR